MAIFKIIVFIFFSIFLTPCIAQSYDSVFINCPNRFITNYSFPIEIEFYNKGELVHIDKEIFLSYSEFESKLVKIKHGKGSTKIKLNLDEDAIISVNGSDFSKIILKDIQENIELSGNFNEDLVLEENKNYYISSDLIIAEGNELIIKPGVIVFIKKNANIVVNGKILCEGTISNPIVFTCAEHNNFWGGIIINNCVDTSFIKHSFFINGGGNNEHVFGHSDSQALVFVKNSNIDLSFCYFMDNIGKALGSSNSILTIKNCFISRCDTGAEFITSKVEADSCYIMFIPDEDGIVDDDDNDGWYFNATHSSGEESFIKNIYIFNTEDDGIDQNGAKLRVENCWIENCCHEGIACSNKNYVNIYNSVFKNCKQGVENGYGKANVSVDHCLFLNNEVGARFGDEYNILSEGKFNITNSVFYNNNVNILIYDPQLDDSSANSLFVYYSLTNTVAYDNKNNCIAGIPIFNSDYTLAASSPGYLAGNDQLSMGLVYSITEIQSVYSKENLCFYPNPAYDYINILIKDTVFNQYEVSIFSISGQKLRTWKFENFSNENYININISDIKSGVYLICLSSIETNIYAKLIINNDK